MTSYPLPNSNARHDDNELAPAIALVQLEHRLDIAVGLTRAGFHLDIEIDPADLIAGKCCGKRQVLPSLYDLYVLQQLLRGNSNIRILEAGKLLDLLDS